MPGEERTSFMPRQPCIERIPAGVVEHRDSARRAERVGRCSERKALLVLVETVHRRDDFAIPVSARVAAQRETLCVVSLDEVVRARRKTCLVRKAWRARCRAKI